ncbi:hypothetical protein EJ06DRAFT_554510 [Trichodelitschia bisporula]|uniref:Uncharacterized protein n=1 Tax=Trichodelitschia bisporula TaxID=703511 RepID=A0A6G1I4G7_9PEZI|nr:hypothetical protein EJ06DRAFT_554510 [Trichodelitschia bisporula]
MPSSSASAPLGRLPRLLPHDLSQYTDTSLPIAALPHSSTSLSELAHLIRLQKYQEQRRAHSRVRLHRWLVSAALSSRLLHCGELAYRTLIENFRSDDRKSFATLYNAIHDVRSSCDATRRYALLEPDMETGKTRLSSKAETTNFSTFMHELPSQVRNPLIEFVSEIRTNPDFLAARIASLSQAEFFALTGFRPPLDPQESVMALSKNAPMKKPVSSVPSPVERLLSFQRHDPVSALIYTVFASSSGPDSAEDLRRTDAWATTCARLITEAKPGSTRLIGSVLDAWAGMRDWPAKVNIELFLMQVLQEGQFILEKADTQPSKTGALGDMVEATAKQLEYAAEEFFDRSVKKLFDVIDDEPSAGGMPEGVLEIGSAILKKLSHAKKLRHAAEIVIIHRWFFSSFLLSALIFPESHGIMSGYHISKPARELILKEIAQRAQRQVLGMEYNLKQTVQIMPEVKNHMENLLQRFRFPRSATRPVLLPAKAITSPRETVEVQPFLVICPSDLVTLVNSLFPERRPSSEQGEKSFSTRGLASSASSMSGVSIPFHLNSTPGNGSSVLSKSVSSMTSDTTSREPLLDPTDKADDSGDGLNIQDHNVPFRIVPTEDCGRRLRMACSEMSRILGQEATAGSCHPCAERWAVLYVSPDGQKLKTRMGKDAEDEDEQEEDSPDTDSDEDGQGSQMDLASDYHQVKESIVKLLQEYELPKNLAPENESKQFSNRTSTHRGRGGMRKDRITTMRIDEGASNSQLSSLITHQRGAGSRLRPGQHVRSNSAGDLEEPKKERPADLVVMLEAAFVQCHSRNEFVNAHHWHKTLEQLRKITSPSLTRDGYAPLLNLFARGPRDSLNKSFSAIEEFEAWFAWLKQSQERHDANIEDMLVELKHLRDKMWYKTAVLTSAGYEEAKNVAVALKLMAAPTKTSDGKPINHNRGRNLSKATSNFLLKPEAQTLDLMAAPVENAGPNKLVDEQAELTLRWLQSYGIENFCKGEERIHRFCLEVDKCVNKLVGDGVLDGPVLWSSELYRRDKDILDSGRQKGDLWLTGVGTLSIASDEEYETQPGRTLPRSLDLVQPMPSSLRNGTQRAPMHSIDAAVNSNNRPVNLMDSQDYFGVANPALSIDSTVTFWSPFQAQAQSPSEKSGTIRPMANPSARGPVMLKSSATVNDDKRRFLLDLKQTLTGLLLSDLGTLVFNGGTETDVWFSSDLGEECIQRSEAEERRRKQKLLRKKSMKTLKSSAREQRQNALETIGRSERGGPAAPVATLQNADVLHHSAGEMSDTPANLRGDRLSAAKKAGLLEFPYNVAFRRLLRKFATHPNPFSKLHALYELELLIIASLSSKSARSYGARIDPLPTVPQSPSLGSIPELSSREAAVHTPQAQNLREAIANVTERRSHSMNTQNNGRGSPSPHPNDGRRSPNGPPSTDMIVEVLQSLFRDAEIRPKTLFRDLQYIAAFVPASILDKTPRGKAFWDAGLVALWLKQESVRYMIEIADGIVAQNTESRFASTSQQGATPTLSSDSVARWSMSDAARMYIITAKECDPVAERELAIFYLTHPDLLPRTLLPLSKPREIFKDSLLNRDRKKEDPNRSDPMTMCVAQHWMEMSKKGGDELATTYLRGKDEMERIP